PNSFIKIFKYPNVYIVDKDIYNKDKEENDEKVKIYEVYGIKGEYQRVYRVDTSTKSLKSNRYVNVIIIIIIIIIILKLFFILKKKSSFIIISNHHNQSSFGYIWN